MILFIGMKASGAVLKALLDAPNFESIEPTLVGLCAVPCVTRWCPADVDSGLNVHCSEQTELPVLDTPLSKRVRQIVAHIQNSAASGRVPRLYIIREREPAECTCPSTQARACESACC